MPGVRSKAAFMAALSAAGALLFIRHHNQPYYPGLFLWTASRFFAAIVGLYLSYCVFVYPYFVSPLRHLPGPKSYNPILGLESTLFSMPRGDIWYQWMETIPNNGLIRFPGLGNMDRLLVTSPGALSEVTVHNSYDYIKPLRLQNFLASILGWGVLLTEGTQHKFQRKNLMPAFHIRHIRELTSTFWNKGVDLIGEMTEEIKKNPNQEFGEWTSRATLDIIGSAGMGHEFRSIFDEHQEVLVKFGALLEPSLDKALYFAANTIFSNRIVKLLPWKLNDVLDDIVRTLNRVGLSMVEEKKIKIAEAKGEVDKDILTVIISSGAFTNQEMVDQFLTFLAAGHETTASALTWGAYMLSLHPEMQVRLREEVRKMLPSPLESTDPMTYDQIEACPYLNAVVNETLRFYPTVPLTVREAIKDTTIQGQKIPAGTRLFLVPWATNKSKQLWGPDADTFNPERWMAPGMYNSGGAESNFANMSFLHGPRSCIGQSFAKGSFKCLLACVVGRFEFELQHPGQKIGVGGAITTKPVGGMNLKFKVVEGW